MAESPLSTGISVVVPVFNSEGTLPELITRLGAVLSKLTDYYEAVLVNDGSRDSSWQIISSLCDRYDWVRGIDLMRNYGQHNALLCGIRQARFDITITIDDDLQNPPEEIPSLLSTLGSGLDVVYGTPRIQQHGLWRDAASQITRLALRSVMGAETARHASSFRAIRTQLREAFAGYHGPLVSIDVMLTWGTTHFGSVFVEHHPRTIGQSNYTFRKLVRHALTMVTGFSIWPLQLASLLGFAFTLFGMGIFTYVVGRMIVQGSIPGFPFLASTIAIFSGTQLFALGIIGEYLARIHLRASGQPEYSIRSKAGGISAVEPPHASVLIAPQAVVRKHPTDAPNALHVSRSATSLESAARS